VIGALFFVVLVMALFALRSTLRARRTYTLIGVAVPSHLNTSLLSLGTTMLIVLANLLGLTSGLGFTGAVASILLAVITLSYANVSRK
jgi:hypothetical protein